MDLWEWQDDDVERLEREGKGNLAAYWYRFGEESPALELKEAADLARDLGEPWWELFYRHWEVQQSLWRQRGNLQVLREECARLNELAGDPACQGCPQRFCARESVCNTLSSEDPVASAETVLDTASRMNRAVPGELACSGCFGIMKVGPLIRLGRMDEAEALVSELIADEDEENRLCIANLYAAEIAGRRGDKETMDRFIHAAARLVSEGGVNEDNGWFVTEQRVRRHLLDDDIAGAEAVLSGQMAPPPETEERIRSLLAIAEGKARLGDDEGSQASARDAAGQALRRGFVRYAAEGALLADEASARLSTPDEERERDRTTLANCLVQMASRDLDARAKALGIAW